MTGEDAAPATADFDYELPESRIARYPADRRDRSRLLVLRREDGSLEDRRFDVLPELLDPGDALVLNDTRVFPARLRGRKPTGARAEVFLLRPMDGGQPAESGKEPGERRWRALVRPGGKLKPGREVVVADDLTVTIEDSLPDGARIVRLEGEGEVRDLIDRHGEVPLPPYIDREPEAADRERYQTVYAEHRGSVAAPTAGLHFTPELLEEVADRGVAIVRVTLHVGVGTFRPVDAERPEDHELHAERYRVAPAAARTLNRVRREGGRVWAVGTTAVRTLETVVRAEPSADGGADERPDDGSNEAFAGPEDPGRGPYRAGEGWTDLFIHPPYRFRGVDALITNFHLPRSSLLMLVAAFAGTGPTLRAYRHAVEEGYRFYSYGDAMAVL